MINKSEETRLVRSLSRAKCVLFIGAGFSTSALDANGRGLPAGSGLASELWDWSGLATKYGKYAGQELPRVFGIALSQRGERNLTAFLRERLSARTVPAWYDFLASVYWYRIYTTNVDNVVETVFGRHTQPLLEVVDGFHERPRDRDQFLERIQYVKLNGDLRNGAEKITFSTRAYARRAVEIDPWWDQFVRDYAQHLTVFIGTSLNEPLLNQAIEARGPRGGAAVEGRPGSFLVSKPLDPTVSLSLPEFNIEGIEATAEAFAHYLGAIVGPLPDRVEVLRELSPSHAIFADSLTRDRRHSDSVGRFLAVFDEVILPDAPRNYSSLFHQGQEADWLDIAASQDASRQVGQRLLSRVEELVSSKKGERKVVVLSGNRGTGKTTVLMRLGARLAAEGVPTYFSRGERIEWIEEAMLFIATAASKMVLIIDNADSIGRRGIQLLDAVGRLKNPPVIILGVRSSALYFLDDVEHEDWSIGDLTDADIESLIDTLTAHKSLGILTDAGRERIRSEFTQRAHKVLLVALKEATLSLGFREILLREFRDIEIEEYKVLYLCAALAGAEDSSLTRGQLMDCSNLTPAEAHSALVRELRGVIVRTSELAERWSARHPLIAIEVVGSIAPRPILATSYRRILSTLASDMDARAKTGEPARAFRLYKRLVNHAVIYERFGRKIDDARSIFEALESRLSGDPHFWLQYGSLELQHGELEWAERHLGTALGLSPNDFLVRTAWAHLKYAQAVAAIDQESAVSLRGEACQMLDELIRERGEDSSYPWHIKLTQSLQWLNIWGENPERLKEELLELRILAEEAVTARPRSNELREAAREVTKEYLRLATADLAD